MTNAQTMQDPALAGKDPQILAQKFKNSFDC